jgi:hypothetical protein
MMTRLLGGCMAILLLTAGMAAAQPQSQTQVSPAPSTAPAPGTPSATRPGTAPGTPAREPAVHEMTGTLKKVDAVGKTVEVSSGLFGILGRTLEITDDTRIRAEGRPEGLTALREGARVRAEYESRDGKNIAKSIEVMPEEPGRATRGPAGQPKTTP